MAFLKPYFGILLGFFSLLLRAIFKRHPEWVESFYSRGWFQAVRLVLDFTISLLPIPLFYLFFGGLLFAGLALLVKNKPFASFIFPKSTWSLLRKLANFAGWTTALFLVLWGFNYLRQPIEKTLALHLQPLGMERVISETALQTQEAVRLRDLIPEADTFALSADFLPPNLECIMRTALESVLDSLGYPTTGAVRVRRLLPKGVLLRWGTSGFYLPFVGQGNLDAGLHPLQQPFVMAHEMAHGYGFGDEGTCNFLAYLACMQSTHPVVKYTGALAYWQYIAGEYRFRSPEEYQNFRKNATSLGMRKDLAAIYANNQKYPDFLPKFRDKVYEKYLNMQGIDDGLENYNRVVILMTAWRNQIAAKPK